MSKTPIEKYRDAKDALAQARYWRSLIGAQYNGGGGGIGKIVSPRVSVSVYHQAHDGATNYHEAPYRLMEAMCDMIDERFLDAAIAEMERKVRVAATIAHEDVMALAAEMEDALATTRAPGEGP